MKAKDLAKKLGVSPATISLVLNNKPGISRNLRMSLLEQIREMGCGHMIAEKEQTDVLPEQEKSAGPVIAYLIYTSCDECDPGYAFYPAVMEGAETEARETHACLSVIHRNREQNVPLSTLLRRAGNVIGAIIQASELSERALRDVESLSVPFVFVDFYRPDLNFSGVCVNNEQGIFSLVRHLKELGHTRIGYVYSRGFGESVRERKRCFHNAMREYGLEDGPGCYFGSCEEGVFGEEDGPSEFQRLVSQFSSAPSLPTALVAEDDREAAQVIQALRHLGLQVPQDVSVTGFDDSVLCSMMYPTLTTVKNYRHLMGRECVVMLRDLIRLRESGVKDPCLKYEIATRLVVRESVRPLAPDEG